MPTLDHLYPYTPAITAHRGASFDAPENTLPAFELALAQGAYALELDARLSKDGVVVVMHDATVGRTTDGSGKVAALTLADLKTLDAGAWKRDTFSGVQVPTLAEVFETVRHKAWINVELKDYTTWGDRSLEAAVVKLIHKMNMQQQVLISSFNPLMLRNVHKFNPALPLGLLTSIFQPLFLSEAWFARLTPHHARHPDRRQISPTFVKRLHHRGLRVNTYTVNDPEAISTFATYGVDGIITDRPALARTVLSGGKNSIQ